MLQTVVALTGELAPMIGACDKGAETGLPPMRLLLPLLIGLLVGAAPAVAIEQNCRFIQAKVEREACYHRQEDELAARRKPEPAATSDSRTFESLQQMRREDEEVYRSLRSICRGC